MNLDILGSAGVTSENVFVGGRCWVYAKGLKSKLGSGWFEIERNL
jgi:hypothetical protein